MESHVDVRSRLGRHSRKHCKRLGAIHYSNMLAPVSYGHNAFQRSSCKYFIYTAVCVYLCVFICVCIYTYMNNVSSKLHDWSLGTYSPLFA